MRQYQILILIPDLMHSKRKLNLLMEPIDKIVQLSIKIKFLDFHKLHSNETPCLIKN